MENEKEFETTETGERIFKVPECNVSVLRERIAKLNKKAVKLGCAAITVSILQEFEVTKKVNDVNRSQKFFELTVSGTAPKIDGWEFIAVVQQMSDEGGNSLGNILRAVPGASCEVPIQYRSADSHCDHCNVNRRRNDTFILHSYCGETKQVGRQCLRDFLGHTSPETLCAIAQMLLDAEDFASDSERGAFGAGQHTEHFQAEEILALAACSVRLNGWRSNATASAFGSLSTSGEVSNWINSDSKAQSKWEKPLLATDEDKQTAHEVAEWLSTLGSRTELNDYMYNLSVLGQGASFTTKNFGLACSAIPTYLREMEKEINRRKRFESDAASQYVGTPGERSKFTLTLVFTRDCESQFGVSYMYKFKDEDGNILVWFASNVFFNDALGADINIGDTVVVDARVKSHEMYQEVRQTLITRCKTWVSAEDKKAAAKARKAERLAALEVTA